MNLFILDQDPIKAAKYNVDKHVVKIPLEAAQLLCAAFPPNTAPYRRTHYNHPVSKWVRASRSNFLWTIVHGLALCNEYTIRYKKEHACKKIILWCLDNIELLVFPQSNLTKFVTAMPEHCIDRNSPIESYRNYYRKEKRHIANWKTETPNWWF